MARLRCRGWRLAAGLGLALAAAAAADVGGRIRGRVVDEAGRPLTGVIVVATGPTLQGERTELSDADGQYYLAGLPPGEYVLGFFYESVTTPRLERRQVAVSADATALVNARL